MDAQAQTLNILQRLYHPHDLAPLSLIGLLAEISLGSSLPLTIVKYSERALKEFRNMMGDPESPWRDDKELCRATTWAMIHAIVNKSSDSKVIIGYETLFKSIFDEVLSEFDAAEMDKAYLDLISKLTKNEKAIAFEEVLMALRRVPDPREAVDMLRLVSSSLGITDNGALSALQTIVDSATAGSTGE